MASRRDRHGNGNGNGNSRGHRNGFGDFGNFPDPFANFGMGMGGGSQGRNIFDVFDNDPFFNEPFFTRPFGRVFGSQSGGFFGQQGFIGDNLFQNQTVPRPRAPVGGYLEDRLRNLPHQVHQRDPIVVEVEESDSDVDGEPHASSSRGQQPIIEHPDDDVRPEPQERSRPFHSVARQAGPLPEVNNNGGCSYSFQSSSVSYGGPNGTYYTSSAARRLGPDGVIEEEFQEKDSTSGQEVQRISRGLGVKGRSITRKRTSEGREQTMETLHNLQEDEVPTFERTWEDRAKALPQWNRNQPHTIGAPLGNLDFLGPGSRLRAALPGTSSLQAGCESNHK